MRILIDILNESFTLLAQMGPYFLLGIFIAGLLHVVLKMDTVAKHLGANSFWAVFKASILGIPLPICSCGVVPLAASIKKAGAGNGATVSFLTTTPTTGVDSILATYSLLGAPLAFLRVAASFIIGLVAGLVSNVLTRRRAEPEKLGTSTVSSPPLVTKDSTSDRSHKFRAGILYSFDELMAGIARPLIIGIALAGVITYYIPADFLADYATGGIVAYLIMVLVGTPLYICATGSIPLAAALMMKGVSPGAALVFLIAGPATNMASLTVISSIIGKRNSIVYLLVLIGGAIGTGYATDYLFAVTGWTATLAPMTHASRADLTLLEYISGTLVGLLAAFHVVKPYVNKLRHSKPHPTTDAHATVAIEYIVSDMTCKHCVHTIVDTVESLNGVTSVHVDLATKHVVVYVNGDIDTARLEEAVKETIINAGYTPENT